MASAHHPEDCRTWIEKLCAAEGLPTSYAASVRMHLRSLAQHAEELFAAASRPIIVGISGGQGSGKSTLARFLEAWLARESGLRCARLSLDDVYLDSAARQALAAELHPLLATRGVPGTHDVKLANELLDALAGGTRDGRIRLPVFDKALDDRAPEDQWTSVHVPVDVVLFEGWCVGARPQAASLLTEPVNELEAVEDADGGWRRYVNRRLETDYAELFARLDALIMLRIPRWSKVLEWRALQEVKLRQRAPLGPGSATIGEMQSSSQFRRFVMHYERLTRHMLQTMPARADSVIDIGPDHCIVGRSDPGWETAARERL